MLSAVAAAAAIGPASASAACPEPAAPATFSTSWIGGSGHYNTDANWTNGMPTAACDASITAAGSYTVMMTAGSNAKSMTIGGAGSNPTLQISSESPNTNLNVAAGGFLEIKSGAAITLKCNVTPSSCAAPNLSAPTISNAGTITVDANVNGNSFISGAMTNTGTLQFDHTAQFNNEAVVNKGTVNIGDATTVLSGGSSCGDTSVAVKNDAGGSINATGSGTFSITNYEQGNGVTTGANPVQIPCGSLKYTGNGDSKVMAYAGFNLTGTIQSNQSLTVNSQSNNTNVFLQGDVTNNGSITLSCFAAVPPAPSGCNGGDPNSGVGFSVAGHDFVNAGTFAVAAASGTGSVISTDTVGSITNTGTMSFDQDARFGGTLVNQGAIDIATGKVVRSSSSSCGGGGLVKNDTGGQINATGTGTFEVLTLYEQGAGITSGVAPVTVHCGAIDYSGTGAGTVLVNAASVMAGNIASGQTLRIAGSVNSPAFTNAGTIVFDQSGSSPTLNSVTLTNTGRVELVGPSANSASITGQLEQTGAGAEVVLPSGTKLNPGAPVQLGAGAIRGGGTVNGSIVNSGGVVEPGESLGTLTLGGSYLQQPGGRLEIDIDGTGLGQFDRLAIAGNATLGGTVALLPGTAFAGSAAVGDSVPFLTYGDTRSGEFATTTSGLALACPRQLAVAYENALRSVNATVSDSGATCGGGAVGGGGGGGNPPAAQPARPAETVLKSKPKSTIKTKKAKLKVKFSFSSDLSGATFECKLDKGAYAACASPKSYTVKPGKHTFSVRAGGAGGVDASPATYKFKVVKTKSR